MKCVIHLTVSLIAVSGVANAESECASQAKEVVQEVENDGGTEFSTLEQLADICIEELGKQPADKRYFALQEVRSHVESWQELQIMLKDPPSSMKEELQTNRKDIAVTLKRDLKALISSLE